MKWNGWVVPLIAVTQCFRSDSALFYDGLHVYDFGCNVFGVCLLVAGCVLGFWSDLSFNVGDYRMSDVVYTILMGWFQMLAYPLALFVCLRLLYRFVV